MSRLKLLSLYKKSLLQGRSLNCSINSTRCLASAVSEDEVTHTGQRWDSNDYRLVRFTDKPKQVNPNFAIKLINEVPPQVCAERVVWCDGGGGPTGHPKVFINLDKPGNHACGYCGLRFCFDAKHH